MGDAVHLYIDQSSEVGVCLNRIPERQCWTCTYRKFNVFNQALIVLQHSECDWHTLVTS